MKSRIYQYLKLCLLVFGLTVFVFNCQQEDDIEKQNQTSLVTQKSTTKTVSGKDVPEVLNFIQSKSNSRMQFTLDDSNSPEGQFRNHEENLSLTTTLTEQIKQVTNSYGKSNYTFKLIEEETKEGVYFLNLVVKEYRDIFYLYIVKYVPDTNWLKTFNGLTDFSSFTGTLYYYSEEGSYLLKANMIDGTSNSIHRDQCPDGNDDSNNNDDDEDESDSTGGGSGGGDPVDPNSGNNDNNNDGGNNESNGGVDWGDYGDNSGGWGDNNTDGGGSGGCELIIETECINHEAGGECGGTITTHTWDCGGEYSANPSGSSRDPFGEFLRNPCPDEDCASINDCEFGWDENCECLDESIDEEEDENNDVAIITDDLALSIINNCAGPLNFNQTNWLLDSENSEALMGLSSFINDNECSSEVQEFVELVIEILEYNEDIEYEDLEQLYIDFPDHPCQGKIIIDFTSNNNITIANLIISSFFGNNNRNVQFAVAELNPELDANAYTQPPSDMVFNNNNAALIIFDSNYLNEATDLSIVMSATHEYVHLHLIDLYISGNLLVEYPDYEDLNLAFQDFENNSSEETALLLNDAMHDIYDDFLDLITESVYQYALDNNIEGITEEYCSRLVLGAHQNTDAFQSLSNEEQIEYSTITNNEETGNNEAQGNNCN